MIGSLVRRLELPQGAPPEAGRLPSNPDIEPVPRISPLRRWTWVPLLGFWIAEAFNISTYQVASTPVTKGLSPGLSICAVLLGHILVCVPAMTNGYLGAVYGINFPVLARSSFGVYGAYFVIFVRGSVACIWFGTTTFQGATCVQVMLEAIWPSFNNFPNHIPASAHVTSAQLLCFFLFAIVQLPILWVSVPKLRYLFILKSIIMPIFGFTLFIWAVVAAKGFGAVFTQPTKIVDGVTPAVIVFFQAMTSAISGKATLALNMPDFTRYAKNPKHVLWTQAVGLIVFVTLCGILGVTCTSAVQKIYGVTTWNPLQVPVLWNNRAAQFFCGFCWALAILATNISGNSVSVSNDLALAFPRWINIRRGAYICCIVSIATVPWNIQYNAASFQGFLSGYALFLGPLSGIMLADNWILRKKYLSLRALYRHPDIYSFTKGFNIRAFIAFFLGIAPNLPGLATATGRKGIPVGATYVFSVNWLLGLIISFVIYLGLGMVWKMDIADDKDDSSDQGQIDGVDAVEYSGIVVGNGVGGPKSVEKNVY